MSDYEPTPKANADSPPRCPGAETEIARPTEELLPLVYEELRRLARHRMSKESGNHTLQATALVHEAYLRLMASGTRPWQNRRHFFGAAAEAMRRILIDKARARNAQCRGSGMTTVDMDELDLMAPAPSDELVKIDSALRKFARVDPEKAELVKLKFFVGLTTEEAARILGISEPTAKRYWAYSRAWLFREISKES